MTLMQDISNHSYKPRQPSRIVLLLRRFLVRRYGIYDATKLTGMALRGSRIKTGKQEEPTS